MKVGREPVGPMVNLLIRSSLEIWDAGVISTAAIAVRRLERIKTAMRRGLAGDCPYVEEGGPGTAEGTPPCYSDPEPDDWDDDYPCPECRLKVAEWEHVRPRLALAKRRLRGLIDRRLTEEHEEDLAALGGDQRIGGGG